jgi:hypothetical protein
MAALAAPTLAGVRGSSAASSSAGTIASAAASGSGIPSASSATATPAAFVAGPRTASAMSEACLRQATAAAPPRAREAARAEVGASSRERARRESRSERPARARDTWRYTEVRRMAARDRGAPSERHRRGGTEQTSSPATRLHIWHGPAQGRGNHPPARSRAARAGRRRPARPRRAPLPSTATSGRSHAPPSPPRRLHRRGEASPAGCFRRSGRDRRAKATRAGVRSPPAACR